jgi:hypothetical protein
MFHTKVVDKLKTRILCSMNFFSDKRAVYEILWKNMVERDRPQVTCSVQDLTIRSTSCSACTCILAS